jgi:enterochelin esterase-like enzyme
MPGSYNRSLFLIFIFFIWVSSFWACSAPFQPTQIPSVNPPSTSFPLEQAPTVGITPSQEDPQLIQCSQPGIIKKEEIPSNILAGHLIIDVYFPPCYASGVQDSYPVLYLLHGQTYDQTQWQKLGIQKVADTLIQSGRTIPFLIVMPYEQFYYRSPESNGFPQAIVNELIPWVETNLHGRTQKMWRAVGGISRGASWAMRLGLQNVNLFGAVGGHSLPTFNSDLKQLPDWLEKIPRGQSPRIYLDIGSSDPEVESAIQFEQILNKHGTPNEWHLNEGRHNEDYWGQHVKEYLDWYSLNWRILPSS